MSRAERLTKGEAVTTIRLTQGLNDKLNAYAKSTGIPKSEAMRKGALIYYTLKYNQMEVSVDDDE